ncbi:M20 aminoacylase family protein [Paenalcaligenes faecalis]|uniref:M20 aminoacylase family protein n=1 Tax=Paenalcaligenes faecalis TaxID=2980099 RepID=UPI0022B96A47|nr:M20 aminoacylase family protein [Paenalcaligenes faecalis]
MTPQKSLLTELYSLLPEIQGIRQRIHAHPELGFQELATAALVADYLRQLDIEVHEQVGKTGVVGVLKGTAGISARSIGLRADMDALPIHEQTQLPYQSTIAGQMHACGHDGHTAVLLATAAYLAKHRDFAGTVHFIFQPAEEGLGGAQAMIDEGLFTRFPCDVIFALHNWPSLPPGHIGVNPGPMMAAADSFTVTVKGHGGHGAHPYLSKDPVVASAQLITALQTIVARNVHPFESAVVTVSAMQAGNIQAFSVIPDVVILCGTVRTFSDKVQAQIMQRMQQICDGIAATFDMTIQLDYQKLFPATINTPEYAELVARTATELFGADQVDANLIPSMGAEDFSFMLRQRPGAYFRLGQGGAEQGRVLHNANFDFNDAVIPQGAAMFVRIAQNFLAQTTTTTLNLG